MTVCRTEYRLTSEQKKILELGLYKPNGFIQRMTTALSVFFGYTAEIRLQGSVFYLSHKALQLYLQKHLPQANIERLNSELFASCVEGVRSNCNNIIL